MIEALSICAVFVKVIDLMIVGLALLGGVHVVNLFEVVEFVET